VQELPRNTEYDADFAPREPAVARRPNCLGIPSLRAGQIIACLTKFTHARAREYVVQHRVRLGVIRPVGRVLYLFEHLAAGSRQLRIIKPPRLRTNPTPDTTRPTAVIN
jgi:hypothetical protein